MIIFTKSKAFNLDNVYEFWIDDSKIIFLNGDGMRNSIYFAYPKYAQEIYIRIIDAVSAGKKIFNVDANVADYEREILRFKEAKEEEKNE